MTLARDRLRFLHWNVHSWRDDAGRANHDAVTSLIADTNPDVVSLVEVSEPWAAPAVLPELAGPDGGYTWIFIPAVELGTDAPGRGYGNALLTRLPVQAVQQWQLTWPPTVYDGTEPSESRTVALAKVALPAGAVWAGSTHLPSTDQRARSAALQRLATVIRSLDAPWVVCGDFNVAAADWAGTVALPLVVGPDPAEPSHPARDPVRPIDYCIAAPEVALAAQVVTAAGSDHLPLLVDCRIGAPSGQPGAAR